MTSSILTRVRFVATFLVLVAGLFSARTSFAQLYAPEGLQMCGSWNGYTNYPNVATHFAIRGTTTAAGTGNGAPATGGINLATKVLSGSQSIYTTRIYAAASGGDFVGGSYQFLFTAGSPTNAFGNKWVGTTVVNNTLQSYTYNTGGNANITLANGNYYTMNYKNVGYTGTNNGAIFMVTSAVPQTISTVAATKTVGGATVQPTGDFIAPSTGVTVTATLAGAKSAQENVLIRYSNDGFATSTVAAMSGTGPYTFNIPGQADGITTAYYVFTSTVAAGTITSDYDAYILKFKNAAAQTPYSYTSSSATSQVEFVVDMKFTPVNPAGLYLAGSFNSFASAQAGYQLTLVSGTTYHATITLPNSTTVSYKFVNGGSYESVPGGCATAGNRTYTTGTGNTTVPTVCYAQCTTCGTGATVTFNVDTKFMNSVSGSGLYLAGTFNGFGSAVYGYQMTQVGATSIYTLTTTVPENTTYQYKYVNGGSYETITGGCTTGGNRTYAVGTGAGGPYTVPTNAYTYCGVPNARTITFRVDMTNEVLANGPVTSASVNGDFNGYTFGATPLTNIGGNVWTAAKVMPEGLGISYKFTKNGASYEANVPASSPCNSTGSANNRNFTVPAKDSVLNLNCFGVCGTCPVLNNVTFETDLAYQGAPGTPLEVRGGFNGFSGGDVLTQVGATTKYRITKLLSGGVTYEFKFYNGNWESPSGACIVGGGNTNRYLTVPNTPGTPLTYTACYNLCSVCPAGTNVTFQVNMKEQTVGTNVVVAGSFNSFSTTAAPLVETPSGSKIWVGTVFMPQNTPIDYKFVNGAGTFNYENNFSGPCKAPYNRNRYYAVGSSASTIPLTCFDRCLDCDALNTWTGASSTNYQDGGNWTAGGYASGTTKPIQVNGGGNSLTIPAGITAQFKDVTFSGNPTVTLASTAILDVNGNLAGPGNVSGGTVQLSQTGTQTVSATGSFDILKVVVPTLVNITGNIRINDQLSLGNISSAINTSGLVTLGSNATKTAQLTSTNATYAGNMKVERHLKSAGWHFVGAPVHSPSAISTWGSYIRVSPKNNANIFRYDEGDTTNGSYNGYLTEQHGWKVPATSDVLNTGDNPRGYRLYASGSLIAGSGVIAATGNPYIGNKSIPYTFTPAGGYAGGGWNLLANPYPSEVDWNAVATANGSAPAALNTWNGTAGVYASWTPPGSAVNGGTQYLASGQAFFAKATAAGSYNFTEAQKSTTSNSFVRTAGLANELKMKLSLNGSSDEANVVFWSQGQLGHDRYDADNQSNFALDLATTPVANLSLAINIMPTLDARYEVPVSVSTYGAVGKAILTFTGAESFGTATVLLKDKFLGTVVDLYNTPVVAFDVTSNPATYQDRFSVVFSPESVTAINEKADVAPALHVWPNPVQGSRSVTVSTSHFTGSTAVVTLHDLAGKVVVRQNIATTGGQVSLQDLPAGTYTLRVKGNNETAQQRVVIQ